MAVAAQHAGFGTIPGRDNRRRHRARVDLPAKIFITERQITEEGQLFDLSADGAGLRSTCTAGIGTAIVLYLEGFGRFDGVVVQRNRMRVGVKFQCTETRRERIAAQIKTYLETGATDPTLARNSARVRDMSQLQSFINISGTLEPCEIVDIALSGAALRTMARPPVGASIFFGKTPAVVLRHMHGGIVVKFIGEPA